LQAGYSAFAAIAAHLQAPLRGEEYDENLSNLP
jgi:hypothetical protein